MGNSPAPAQPLCSLPRLGNNDTDQSPHDVASYVSATFVEHPEGPSEQSANERIWRLSVDIVGLLFGEPRAGRRLSVLADARTLSYSIVNTRSPRPHQRQLGG